LTCVNLLSLATAKRQLFDGINSNPGHRAHFFRAATVISTLSIAVKLLGFHMAVSAVGGPGRQAEPFQ